MTGAAHRTRPVSALRDFLHSEAAGGIILMVVAALALVIANSPLAPFYFSALKSYVLGLSVLHWINDALMAVFFLMVGLEIKRELVDGHLSSWPRPGGRRGPGGWEGNRKRSCRRTTRRKRRWRPPWFPRTAICA